MVNHRNRGSNLSMQQRANSKENNKLMSTMIKNEIKESKQTVERIKRGFSLFDLEII